MSGNIANQISTDVAKRVLGCTSEAERRLLEEGLDFGVFQKIIDDPRFRKNLVAYANAGAPEIGLRNWQIWKTIKLGTGFKTADDFRKALKDNRCGVSDWANDILGKPTFTAATEEIEVDLVKVTVGEIGFKSGARRDQIYDRARKLGLELCPAEVGPQLRLQYKDQPNGEWIFIGMEPIAGSGGALHVFLVERHDSELWLDVGYDDPSDVWRPGDRWVFVRPRK